MSTSAVLYCVADDPRAKAAWAQLLACARITYLGEHGPGLAYGDARVVLNAGEDADAFARHVAALVEPHTTRQPA